ncbi:MAG: hypothetical protein ACD_44C00110G0003 [uncultured bacterium]|nr:MAG: hypothetical protein ACD_44C00110G0003 [uncultured bacterium]
MFIQKKSHLKAHLVFSFLFFSKTVFALPVLDNVTSGDVALSQQSLQKLEVTQKSQKAILNWESFNIHEHESVHFKQPENGITLNRINPRQGVSEIFGKLSSTGRIILINPAGIYFGPTSRVDVGSLIASTANITDKNFLNGKYHFAQEKKFHGDIINKGTLIAKNHGLIALAADSVRNDGLIEANLGEIVLASGKKFTINFAENDLVSFVIDAPLSADASSDVAINNTGVLRADGGEVLLTAQSASRMLDQAINMEGIIQAQSVSQKNGVIILSGDENSKITVSGSLDVSGKNPNTKGGSITVTGNNLYLTSTAQLDASGDQGGGIIRVGGNYRGQGPLLNANFNTTSQGAKISADAISQGNGGEVIFWGDTATGFHGSITARGGALGGDGGFVETSGNYLSIASAKVNTSAAFGKYGTWFLDPTDVSISTSATSNESFASGTYTPSTDTANINTSELETNLGSGNVSVITTSGGSGAGNITVTDSIAWSASSTLTLTAGNNLTINASSISDSSGGLILTATSGTIGLNGATLTVGSGGFTANDPVQLGTDVTITAGTGAITFNDTINSSSATARNLTLSTSGTQTFQGIIGATNALASLTTGTGTAAINSWTITTNGSTGMVFNGPVVADMTSPTPAVFDAGTGPINFTSTLNSGSAQRGITLTTSGTQTFGGAVGGTLALDTLDTGTGSVVINGGSMTIGAGVTGQTYNGPVTLGADTTFTTTNKAVTFNSTLNSSTSTARAFTASLGSGALTFTGNVGATNALGALSITNTGTTTVTGTVLASSLTKSGTGATAINGGSISTSGSQSYAGAVSLGANTTLTLSGSGSTSLSLANNISGGYNLTLTGSAGNNTFTLGGTLTLGNVAVNGYSSGTNTFSLDTSGTQAWTISSANTGSLSSISSVSGAFTFSNIGSLTGGSGNDTFSFSDGASLTGTLDGGTLGSTTNSITYANYTTPITATLSANTAGATTNSSGTTITGAFTNMNNLTTSTNGTLKLPSTQSNTLAINSATAGSLNNTNTVNAFTTFVSRSGNDTAQFNTAATINRTAGTAVVDGTTLTFTGFSNFTGSLTPVVEASQNSTINAVILQSDAISASASDPDATTTQQSPEATTTINLINSGNLTNSMLTSMMSDVSMGDLQTFDDLNPRTNCD